MRGGFRRWGRAARDIALVAAGLLAVSFLPPDTALREREKVGSLRYCVADVASPLITNPEDGRAGPERESLARAAAALGLRLELVEVANMNRSFNPADWNVTRGQCDLIGGGLADSAINRDFLTLLPTGDAVALVANQDWTRWPQGQVVGIYLGTAGFDRIGLSRWIRAQGWQAVPVRDAAALRAWRHEDQPLIASSLLLGGDILSHHALPPEVAQQSALALGFWRGDMTLTRAISRNFE